jgi:hypothetical protein
MLTPFNAMERGVRHPDSLREIRVRKTSSRFSQEFGELAIQVSLHPPKLASLSSRMRDDLHLHNEFAVLFKKSMESTNLRQGDERAYQAMATAIQTSMSELLVPFKEAASAEDLLKRKSIEQFFQEFLTHADRSTDKCCEQFATIMRQCALVPDVRGTPTLALAKEIRAQVFEPLDGVLISYVQALNQIGMDLHSVSAELSASSIINAAMQGAAVGQLAGGLRDSGKTLGAYNALRQVGAEAEKKLALFQERAGLERQAKSLPLLKIAAYLERVTKLPERLMDYGCARCFGGQVSLERQQAALEGVLDAIARELRPAVDLTLAIPGAERRVQEQRLIAGKTQEEASRKQQEMESKKPAPGQGIALLALSVGLAVWAFASCDLQTPSEADMGWDMGWALILLVGAGFALVSGIMKFFDRRPKMLNPGVQSEAQQVQPGKFEKWTARVFHLPKDGQEH